jgi:hypothetical protein
LCCIRTNSKTDLERIPSIGELISCPNTYLPFLLAVLAIKFCKVTIIDHRFLGKKTNHYEAEGLVTAWLVFEFDLWWMESPGIKE